MAAALGRNAAQAAAVAGSERVGRDPPGRNAAQAAAVAGLERVGRDPPGRNAAPPPLQLDETPVARTRRIFRDALLLAQKWRVCEHCTSEPVFYRECDNVGRLECRYHPGGYAAGAYSCCGYRPSAHSPLAHGCVACDHSMRDVDAPKRGPRWTNDTMRTRVALYIADEFMPREECIVRTHVAAPEEPEASYLVVLRVDPQFADG